MKILHLSDFHYKSSEKDIASQQKLVNTLITKMSPFKGKIDFLLFTGDLTFSGKNKEDFDRASIQLLGEIGKALKIEKPNVLICPGNHDVNRQAVVNPIRDHIRTFKSEAELTKFVEVKDPHVYELSCNPIDNYKTFIDNFFRLGIKHGRDITNPLYSIHKRELRGKQITFLSINTAWQSSGDDDKGNLFFPKTALVEAIQQLDRFKPDWKILLLHHPLDHLRDFNKLAIEDTIYSEFHFMFSGHLHKREDFIRLTFNDGILGSHAAAAFTKKEEGKIGFSIFDIDFETLDIIIQKFYYDFDENLFFDPVEIKTTFPCNESKSDQIKIFRTLRKRYNEILDRANDLFVSTKIVTNGNSFLELFIEPVLRTQSEIEAPTSFVLPPRFENNKLFEKRNFVIHGKDKTGKTSILYNICLQLLSRYSELNEIPFYIDLAEFKAAPYKLDILRLFARFIEQGVESTKYILKNYSIKLLFDNFDPNQKEINSTISNFIKTHPSCTYVIISDQTLARSFDLDYGIDGFEALFIHDISRSEIRQLTRKWPNIPADKREEFIDKITGILRQHSMPFNFWTLSIFLWIFSGKNTLNFYNSSELIELYIDDLLDRNRLASDPQNRFSYQNYKIYLSSLANHLLIKHLDTNYSIKYADLVSYTEDFMNNNPKRVGDTSEVINYLLDKGVFKKLENDYITFRLNGVFEYFIAFNFSENKDFLKTILKDDNYFLSFKNEFEIYSGFARSEQENKEFLQEIFLKTKSAFSELFEKMSGDIDMRLHHALTSKDGVDFSAAIGQLPFDELTPLTDDEKDQFFDESDLLTTKNSEVRNKKLYDANIKNFEILERYLFINARVFRNIENINDKRLINEVFDFLVDASCFLGFALIEEIEITDGTNILDFKNEAIKKVMIDIINNYLPSVVQGFIFDAMGHINLEAIIEEKTRLLNTKFRENQYKLYILNCLLLDIDLKKHKKKIDIMIEQSKMGIIKSSLLLKLYSLLLFKSFDDEKMVAFLKEKIRAISVKIDPKVDMKKFDQKFEKTFKSLLFKRQQT